MTPFVEPKSPHWLQSCVSRSVTMKQACSDELVTCAGEMLYMGSPAQPVFKSNGSEKAAGPKQETAKLMFQTWPFVQAAIAFGITTLATYITAVVALASVALYGSTLQVRPLALSFTVAHPSSLSLIADTPTITNVCTSTQSVVDK